MSDRQSYEILFDTDDEREDVLELTINGQKIPTLEMVKHAELLLRLAKVADELTKDL